MYSTQWCGYCARLKNQLDREGISYDVVDIERVPDAAVLVEQAEACFEAVNECVPLRMRQSLVINASEVIYKPDVTSLRQEGPVVHESPKREEPVDAAGVLVVAEDAADPHHGATSISTRSCFPGSYRLRAFDEASRIRSISGSRAVAHRANPYNPPAMSSPARNE